MPTVLRQSGRDFVTRQGVAVHPLAMIHFCEGCGVEGAGFGLHVGDKLLSYCGWVNGAPVCKVNPQTLVPLPSLPAPPKAPAAPDLFK